MEASESSLNGGLIVPRLFRFLKVTVKKHFFDFLKVRVNQLKPHLLHGPVKGAILCFKNLYFYFRHGESTSTAS